MLERFVGVCLSVCVCLRLNSTVRKLSIIPQGSNTETFLVPLKGMHVLLLAFVME